MQTKKYKTEYIDLKTREKKPIRLLDILDYGDKTILSFGYNGLKRTPYAYYVTYNGITVCATTCILKPVEDVISYLSYELIRDMYIKYNLI